jgi:hypothetical protein
VKERGAVSNPNSVELLRNLKVPEGWNGTERFRDHLIKLFCEGSERPDLQAFQEILMHLTNSHIEVVRYIGELNEALITASESFNPEEAPIKGTDLP